MTTNSQTTTITTTNTGVMTNEVGIITGDIEIISTCTPDGNASTTCRYKDADEWYTITDTATTLHDPTELAGYHNTIINRYK